MRALLGSNLLLKKIIILSAQNKILRSLFCEFTVNMCLVVKYKFLLFKFVYQFLFKEMRNVHNALLRHDSSL